MKSGEGTGKWVLAVFFAVLLTVTLCYPDRVLFLLKMAGDLLVENIRPLLPDLPKHWPF